MNDKERRILVGQRYAGRCGYCGVHEIEAGAELEVDHFQPRTAGGRDELDNLVYCCTACNRIKADFWSSDMSPDNPMRLLHPKRDVIEQHVVERSDGSLEPITATGAFHVNRLRLNRPPLVALRRTRIERRQLQQKLAEAQAEQVRLKEAIARLMRELDDVTTQISRLLDR